MNTLLQILLLFSLLFSIASPTELPVPLNDEVLSLIVFKSAITDPNAALATWTESDATPCSWTHVECNPATSRVVRLSLDSLGLSGELPRGLDRLTSLHSLSLSHNNLSGPVPVGLSLLPNLHSLDLSFNYFSGNLPEDTSLMPSLRYLDLSFNSFSGPLPGSFPSSLRFLLLSGNRFSGPLPPTLSQCSFLLHINVSSNQLSGSPDFSNGFWSLTRLRAIDLSNNQFSGVLPEGMSHLHNLKVLNLSSNRFYGSVPGGLGLCPHLTIVDLSYNALDGSLPESFRYLTSLLSLSASNNRLSGQIPEWIGNMTALQTLDLSNNKLTGNLPSSFSGLKDLSYLGLSNNLLSGAIPDSVSECTRLTELHLRENGFNGTIPQALFNLGLELLDLSSNGLSGTMPPGSARMAETLLWLDLSNNHITGTIPAEMALFYNLRYLNLSWNDLKAQLPPELGLFKDLTVLDLRSSELYGSIPEEICDSSSLAVLQLDGNSLSGPIPDEIKNCSSLYLLSLAHNSLSGPIPTSISYLKRLEILQLEYNNLTGEIPQQLGTLQNLLAVNISHNRLVGRLPTGSIFQTLDQSAIEGNLGICSPLVSEPCRMDVPKPLVLDPNAYPHGNGNDLVTYGNGPALPKRRKFLSISAIIAISAALLIVLGVLLVTLLNISARRRISLLDNALESMCSSSTRSSSPGVGKMVIFGPKNNLRSEDLVDGAESLLNKATELGHGVFGTVYKASVAQGRFVAVKKLFTANIIQYHDDFDREVRILGKARHPNLMSLKGYYWTPQMQLLISDYVPHGSLHARLHENPEKSTGLTWPDRFKVALGTAKGLAHLHQSFKPPIIHYNIKPSNILLDENCNPKISDFGLARLLPKLDKHIISSRFQGAMGYVAPELACQSLRVNEKCDVYGFGVLILELVTGKSPVEYGDDDVVILIDQVRVLLEQGNVLDCVDPVMGEFPEEEVLPMLKLGLVCTSQIPSSRPSMGEVVQILEVIKAPIPERMEGF
ncbi:leucine-rich receptor-like protein kinase family protein [Carex rostrata]